MIIFFMTHGFTVLLNMFPGVFLFFLAHRMHVEEEGFYVFNYVNYDCIKVYFERKTKENYAKYRKCGDCNAIKSLRSLLLFFMT